MAQPEGAGRFMLKLPASINGLDESHPLFELSRAVLAGDASLVRSTTRHLSDVGLLVAPLDAHGVNLLHVAAISNRPEVMGSLLDTIEAQQETVTQNLKLEARKETVEASRTGPLSVLQSTSRSAQLNAYDRLFHIACEQQFIDLLSVPDAQGRTTLHYAASARGVMVDFLLSYRKKRFLQASTGEGLHRVPLFPAGGFVHPGTGDLWLPGGYAAAVGITGSGSSTLGVDALGGGGAGDDAAAAPGGFVPVSALVRARTDPAFTDARDAYGGTPLMYATVASDVRSIRSLLEHGADGFAATAEGLTPLDLSSNRIVRAALVPMEAAVQSACGVNAPRAGVRTPARGAAAALLSTTAATIASGSSSAGAGAGLGALALSASLTVGVSGGGAASVRRGGLGSSAASSALRSPGGFRSSGGALSSSGGGGLGGSGGRRGSAGMGATDEAGGDSDARRLRAEASLMLLVNSGEDINGRSGIHMRAPLHIAVENGALEVVELLLNNGAVVDICDVNGATPLHLAAEAGSFVHQEIVRLLCDAGAAVNATSSLRKSPLHFAATGATGGSAAARERAAAAGPSLPSAAAGAEAAGADAPSSLPPSRAASPSDKPTAAGRRSRADSLGGALGATHGAGASPYAVEDGGSGMVALLVSLGANIDAVDAEGNTALIAAAKRGNVQTVDTLLTLGARLYAQNSHGMTALHVATFSHHIPVVRQLVRWDAEFGRLKFVLDTSGRSAYDVGADSATRGALHTLFEACASGRLDLAQSVASAAAELPAGAAAPWLPLRATDVTRVLRRGCLHATVTGAARALAKWRAEGGVSPTAAGAAAGASAGATSASGMGSPARKGSSSSSSAAPASPARSGRTPKPAASAVHTVAGIGLRFSAHKGWAAGAPQPPPAARMAWGASPADVSLAFYEPPDPETTTLSVDPYAFCAPPERAAVPATAAAAADAPGSSGGGGGGRRLSSAAFPSAASGGSSAATSLAARRLVPGSELTSPQAEKEFGRVLEFLLRSGCPVDAPDLDGVTAAMLAARYGLLYLLRKLLARGASPAAADRAGNTALHYAYAFGHVTAAGIVEEACSEEVAGARNAAGRSALEVAAAGLRILPDCSEQLLIIRPPPRRSSTLAVSAAV